MLLFDAFKVVVALYYISDENNLNKNKNKIKRYSMKQLDVYELNKSVKKLSNRSFSGPPID